MATSTATHYVEIRYGVVNPTTHINLSPGSPDGGTSPDQTAWYKSPAGVSISTTDTGGPGVKEMRCVLDPASVPTGWNDFPSGCAVDGTSVSASGHHTIYAISRDWDGRASAVAHSSFSVDATAPTVTPLFNGSSTLARSYSSDVTVTYSCQDEANGSGVDPATCPQSQTFTYEDDTSATVPAQSAQDYAGNSGSSNSVKITFEKGQPDDVVLAGDCGAAVFCPHYLTTTEADGTVSLRGYIEAPQNDDGFLRINWGDGSPVALYFYPCDPSATSCPFSNGPTFDTGAFIPPPGQDIFFRFDHTYANNPIGGSTYTITVNSVESDGGASTPQTTTATVTDVAPSLTLEPDCRDVFCVYPPPSTLTATTSTPVSLSGQVTDPGLDTGTVTIDWGDGSADTTVPFDCQTAGELCPTPSQQNAFVCGLTQTAGPGCGFFLQSHTYAHTGTYTISATATDQDGESSSVQTTSATVASLPLVATQPQNQNVVDSTTVSFSSTATAIPSPTVQWQVSTDGGKTFSDISGATSTTLSFTAVVSMSGNEYRAVFTTAAGSVDSDAATLTVGIPPSITTQPIDTTVGVGQTATFTAGASGTPTSTVQWLVSTNGGSSFAPIPGATSTTLSFTASLAQSGNEYVAIFHNSAPGGNATTNTATLTVVQGPAVTTQPTDQNVNAGQTATFTAGASGTPTPTVQWQVSVNGGQFTNVSGATSTTLSITAAQSQSGNQYRAVFTNTSGSVNTNAATLTVRTPPSINTQPTDQSVTVGQTASFTAGASGTPTPTVQWQLAPNGSSTFTNISGATSTTYSFTAALSQSGNRYRAVFTNTGGSATTNPATLTVTNPVLVPTNGAPVAATEGKAVSNAVLGTFTDSNSAAPASSFAATVCWNDSGTPPNGDCGTAKVTGSGGHFAVSGSHTYAEEGTFTAVTTITDTNNHTVKLSTTINVGDAPLTLVNPIGLTSNANTALVLLTFTDGNKAAPTTDFTATINWGDGNTTTGQLAAQKNGNFTVAGSHSYTLSRQTTYTITMTVHDVGGASLTGTATLRFH